MKKSTENVLYFFYLVFLVVLALYVIHHFWYKRLEKASDPDKSAHNFSDQLPEGFSKGLLNAIGAFDSDKASRFDNFPAEKKARCIRIGAFGDSFTLGGETGVRGDFPTLFRELFAQNGFKNVEVLNFGNAWHGFHQAFRIWEELGPRSTALTLSCWGRSAFKRTGTIPSTTRALTSRIISMEDTSLKTVNSGLSM